MITTIHRYNLFRFRWWISVLQCEHVRVWFFLFYLFMSSVHTILIGRINCSDNHDHGEFLIGNQPVGYTLKGWFYEFFNCKKNFNPRYWISREIVRKPKDLVVLIIFLEKSRVIFGSLCLTVDITFQFSNRCAMCPDTWIPATCCDIIVVIM